MPDSRHQRELPRRRNLCDKESAVTKVALVGGCDTPGVELLTIRRRGIQAGSVDPSYDLMASSQLTATDNAAQRRDMVAGRGSPGEPRKRSRERSWTLSRFTTDECRMPSSLLSGAWVDSPDGRGDRSDDQLSGEAGRGIAGEDDDGTDSCQDRRARPPPTPPRPSASPVSSSTLKTTEPVNRCETPMAQKHQMAIGASSGLLIQEASGSGALGVVCGTVPAWPHRRHRGRPGASRTTSAMPKWTSAGACSPMPGCRCSWL